MIPERQKKYIIRLMKLTAYISSSTDWYKIFLYKIGSVSTIYILVKN